MAKEEKNVSFNPLRIAYCLLLIAFFALFSAAADEQGKAAIPPESAAVPAAIQAASGTAASGESLPETGASPAPAFSRPLRQVRADAPAPAFAPPPALASEIPGLDEELTQQYIKRYSTKANIEWLSGIMKNAEPYMAFIQGEIAKRSLPTELLYVPVIESGFVNSARSRAGAAGMWQFMRNSIAPFDMKITDWVDERMDFWKSTMGALEKLQENYQMLGDWPLALAAYNMGLGGMNSVIKKTGIRDYWALSKKGHLKTETTVYMPKLLAVSYILSHPRQFGINALWPDDPQWTRIKVGRTVDLEMLASAAGVDASLLKKANQELFFIVTPPDANYHLNVRSADAEKISAVLERTDISLVKYYFYEVKSGDTLSGLALHYGVSVEQIQQSNPGVQPKTLKIGKRLIIPAFKDVGPYQGAKKSAGTDTFGGSHLVKKGETLWSIARAYNIDPGGLAATNNMGLNDILREGKSLKVPIR